MQTINYGIHRDYLQSWGLKEALREIFQNFIDYGEYKLTDFHQDGKSSVVLSNEYSPKDLEFLAIGKSIKHHDQSIGKHGEGLKMALLIFLREGLEIFIDTPFGRLEPYWETQPHIGETLAINIDEDFIDHNFNISFIIPTELYQEFFGDIIEEKDKIFTHSHYGSIVNRPKGNLYSGGLFVCHLKGLSKSYDILPKELPLDRDRKIPQAFDVSYKTSKINEAHAEWNFEDQNYSDTAYINSIPTEKLKGVKAREVHGKVEFFVPMVNEETKEVEMTQITNNELKSTLKQHSYFQKAVNGIKNYIASKLGVKDLLLQFRSRYCNSTESRKDFDIILERLGIDLT